MEGWQGSKVLSFFSDPAIPIAGSIDAPGTREWQMHPNDALTIDHNAIQGRDPRTGDRNLIDIKGQALFSH